MLAPPNPQRGAEKSSKMTMATKMMMVITLANGNLLIKWPMELDSPKINVQIVGECLPPTWQILPLI